jgi:hypothetical protein
MQNCTFYSRTCQNFMSNHKDNERRENQKSMSLPSITETKNATLLRTRIVILAARYTATSPRFCNSRPEAGGRHPQLTARPTAPDLFEGSGATAPEYHKLSNFTYGSSTSHNIDDEP